MFIRIEEDILESAVSGSEEAMADIAVLEELAIAIRRCKHYVFIPAWTKYRAKIAKLVSKSTFKTLDSLPRLEGYALDNSIGQKLIVSNIQTVDQQNTAFYYAPRNNPSFEVFEETHLLCENVTEKLFYDEVEAFYRKYYARHFSRGTKYSVLPRNGGGVTSAQVLDVESKAGQHMLLVICDSDYKYCFPNADDVIGYDDKGPVGSTAEKLLEVIANNNYKYAALHILENCREVENMLPKKYLQQSHPNNKQESIDMLDNFPMEYLDIKEGIRVMHLFDDKVYEYYRSFLESNIGDLTWILDIRNQHNNSKKKYGKFLKDCTPEERRRNEIIEGWGNNILERVLSHSDFDFSKLRKADLTDRQLKEWEVIGKKLFEWGLASSLRFR